MEIIQTVGNNEMESVDRDPRHGIGDTAEGGMKTDDNRDGRKREKFKAITKINNDKEISKQNKLIKRNDIQIEIIFSSFMQGDSTCQSFETILLKTIYIG